MTANRAGSGVSGQYATGVLFAYSVPWRALWACVLVVAGILAASSYHRWREDVCAGMGASWYHGRCTWTLGWPPR